MRPPTIDHLILLRSSQRCPRLLPSARIQAGEPTSTRGTYYFLRDEGYERQFSDRRPPSANDDSDLLNDARRFDGGVKARESSKGTEGAKEDENVTQPVDVDPPQLQVSFGFRRKGSS